MSKPLFMSPEHVELMNSALAKDPSSLSACKALDRVYWVAYKLDHKGETVWWTIEFNPSRGVRFSLAPPPETDCLLLVGEYTGVVEATRRSKEGSFTPPPVTTEGDVNIYVKVSAAFTAAQSAATFDTEFPAS